MMKYDNRVIVVDSYPGSGKTSWAIKYINELPDPQRIIYITPYLDETLRIVRECPTKDFWTPDDKRGKGSKMVDLIGLISRGVNIASTHSLFSRITDDIIELLRMNKYILFLDEVFQTVNRYNVNDEEESLENRIQDKITKQDVETLLSQGHIKIEDDFRIKWIDQNKKLSKYINLINLADRDLLYFVNGSLLLWAFPIEVFEEGIFTQIFILTHRFESQLQAYYYKYFELEYGKYFVSKIDGQYEIQKGTMDDLEWKQYVKKNIQIVEDEKLNMVGDLYKPSGQRQTYSSALSKSWYDSPDKKNIRIMVIRNNLTNFYVNISKSKSKEFLWTCFKGDSDDIKSKNVSIKNWLECSAKATNDYIHKVNLAYLVNRYVDPFYDDFFEHKNIKINQDEFAVSEMLQWIWRSAIRNGKPILLYIPSIRMRTLLKKYLNNEKIEF